MGRKCINHELRATQCTFEAMKDSLQMFNKSGFCGYGFTSSTNVLITSKIILVKKIIENLKKKQTQKSGIKILQLQFKFISID